MNEYILNMEEGAVIQPRVLRLILANINRLSTANTPPEKIGGCDEAESNPRPACTTVTQTTRPSASTHSMRSLIFRMKACVFVKMKKKSNVNQLEVGNKENKHKHL